jgi:hypothetical protein
LLVPVNAAVAPAAVAQVAPLVLLLVMSWGMPNHNNRMLQAAIKNWRKSSADRAQLLVRQTIQARWDHTLVKI